MFSFFGALFGGLFLTGKLLSEKAEKKDSERRWCDYQSVQDRIAFPLGNSAEYEPPKTRDEFWIMAESVSDDLKYIFGDNWRREINYPLILDYAAVCKEQEPRGIFTCPVQIAYEVWLSKKGRLRFLRKHFHLAGMLNKNTPETQGIVLRACETIEKNLQNAHPDLELRLRQGTIKPYHLVWEHWVHSYNGTLGKRMW